MFKTGGRFNFRQVNAVHNILLRIYYSVADQRGRACRNFAQHIDKAAFEYRAYGKEPIYYKDGRNVLEYAEYLDQCLDTRTLSIREINNLTPDELRDLSVKIFPLLSDIDKIMGIIEAGDRFSPGSGKEGNE